jgi:hypothetical protein
VRPDYMKDCTVACEAMPACSTCHLRKPPRGRSVPLEMVNGLCGYGCPGYDAEPKAGHLWPGELRQYDEEESK